MKIETVEDTAVGKLTKIVARFKDDEVYTTKEISELAAVSRNHLISYLQKVDTGIERLAVGPKLYYGKPKAIAALKRKLGYEIRTSEAPSKRKSAPKARNC